MPESEGGHREGSLDAPTRHPLNWKSAEFFDPASLTAEQERVFDICHGCRRCFSLCNAFPTLFDAVDDSNTGELDGVEKSVFGDVVDHCYLCDMCYQAKCPYVPPHPWNVDFPQLMLRAKAQKRTRHAPTLRDRTLAATDTVGRLAGIPVVVEAVNATLRSPGARRLLDRFAGIDKDAPLPQFARRPLRRRVSAAPAMEAVASDATTGKVALFATCYGNRNAPELGEDLIRVFRHNGLPVTLVPAEVCCGMPKLELGDLDGVERLKEKNLPMLAAQVAAGHDIVAPIPSCVLMFKQQLPLMFPDDADVQRVARRMFDPFEYLMLRHRAGLLNTNFTRSLGKVAWHVACHLRVQNIGLKTRDVLALIPDTDVEAIERCSGHDGTYAVKSEYHATAMKIGRPVVSRVTRAAADYYASDCPMAGAHIAHGLGDGSAPVHPLSLLAMAYGLRDSGAATVHRE